ncbi:MAG: HD domain-containing phosphohydrolase [Bacillota bacterium]
MFFNFDLLSKKMELHQIIFNICNAIKYKKALLFLINYEEEKIEVLESYHCEHHFRDKALKKFNKLSDFPIDKEKDMTILTQKNCCIEGMINEIFLPVFLGNDHNERIINVLYLGTNEKNKQNLTSALKEEKSQLSSQCNLYYFQNKFHSILNILFGMFSRIAEEKESFYESHPYNVAYLCSLISEELGLPYEKAMVLRYVAVLHDIGKIYLKEEILNKKTALTNEEIKHIQMHSIYGYNLVTEVSKIIDNKYDLANMVKWHHENFDGTGYPDGLSGDDIPLESRIIRIADSVDAMLSKRGYKEAKSLSEAIKDIKQNTGTLYDPEVAKAAINILTKEVGKHPQIMPYFGNACYLNIILKDDVVNFHGTIQKLASGYVFKSYKHHIEQIAPIQDILLIEVYIESDNSIYEYETKLDYIDKNYVYFSSLIPSGSKVTFGLRWDLKGVGVFESKETFNIEIKYVSGNFLEFHSHSETLELPNKVNNVIIIWEDGDKILIPGRIVKTYKTTRSDYYYFQYTGIKESVRDTIYKKLFEKQKNLRQGITKSVI